MQRVATGYAGVFSMMTLTVLFWCLAAGLMAGVIGVIIVLPLVASYPIVERIWLRPYLEHDTVKEHQEIDDSQRKEL